MQTKPQIDFHAVEAKHAQIDARLRNWAEWVRPRRPSWISPMFRMARSNSRQWHSPEVGVQIDSLDAQAMEKAVFGLPPPHRDAVRWSYVICCRPAIACRALAVSMDGLHLLVRDGRQMLHNRSAK